MLSKSFKPKKCKTSLKLAEARIKLLRNKRDVQVKSMKKELAQLLESGQEQTARIRVEHVIREEKTMAAYDLIELYCELIAARLPIIESQKTCPIDLKEAVSTIIFASPRCADLPELLDVRKHFTAKYGKEFVNAALEVRPDCGVSRLVVEKLSARAPDVETKTKMLTSIAQEHNIKWDSKAFEEQLQKPNNDLLNGPSTFSSASKIAKETSTSSYSPATHQTKEPGTSQNAVSKPASAGGVSDLNSHTSDSSEPFRSQSESRASGKSAASRIENSHSRKENASSERSTWNVEYKDATSAAQAAAESAERASMAARAAAEFANRENISRQNSSASNQPSTNSVRNERPYVSSGLKLKDEDGAVETLPVVSDRTRNSHGMKPVTEDLRREVKQEFHESESFETNDDFSSHRRAAYHSSSGSSQENVNDVFQNVNDNVKDYDHTSYESPASFTVEQNQKNVKHEYADYGDEHAINYTASMSSLHASTFDDETTRSPKYDTGLVFDDSDSDVEDTSLVFGNNGKSLFSRQEEKSYVPQSTIDLASPKQHTSASPSENNWSHLFQDSEDLPEKSTGVTSASQSADYVPATFDDSDGLSSDGEDEKDITAHNNVVSPTSDQLYRRSSGRNLSPGHGSKSNSYFNEKDTAHNVNRPFSPSSSGANKENYETLVDSPPSSRINKVPSYSYDSSSDEDALPSRSFNNQSRKKTEANERPQLPSSPLRTNDPEVPSDTTDESGLGLNYGRLTGGFKQRGFVRPPYVRNSAVGGDSGISKQASAEKKPIVSSLDQESDFQEVRPKSKVHISRTPEASKDSYSKLYDDESGAVAQNKSSPRRLAAYSDSPKSKVHVSKIPETSKDSYSTLYEDEFGAVAQKKSSPRSPARYSDIDAGAEKLDSSFTAENKASANVKLSRRTRGVQSEGKSSPLKSSVTSSIASESHANTTNDVAKTNKRDAFKPAVAEPRQTSPLRKENPKLPKPSLTERVTPADNEKMKSQLSSGSSESSLKSGSRTHPKLPDYDSLAAHFHSLRSNRS